MSAQRRITRKDIKQDKFVRTTFRVTEYVQNNKQIFIIGLVAIVAVGLIIYLVSLSSASKRAKSVVQLGKADMAVLSGDLQSAIADYEETIDRYGSTINGRKAYILLGRALNDAGQYQRAVEIFNEYLDKYDDNEFPLLKKAALVGLAVAHRGLGERAVAADYYLQAVKLGAPKEEKVLLLFDAARCLGAVGEKDKAMEIYKTIKTEYKYSIYENMADREMMQLRG
jgi:tetratricopeptide (TPR) repeat protein